MTNEHKTAMARTAPSKPMEWLASNDRIVGEALDFGCGRGYDAEEYGMEKYDPHYQPAMPSGRFDTITSNYVLNVIESDAVRFKVLRDIQSKLRSGGKAYITVRADRKALKGRTSRGTYQCEVILRLPVVRKASGYVMYELTRDVTLTRDIMEVRVH